MAEDPRSVVEHDERRKGRQVDIFAFLANPETAAVLFVVFVTVGAAYISVSKMIGMPAAFVTFGPVFLMVCYAALIYFVRPLRLRDDQAGDNLYYMGFLFTLTSLAVSLYQVEQAGATEQIIRNFGVAIASTIAGVALRVLFNQMRRDPIEVEATARLELAEAANRVRRQLDNTVLELNHFRRTTQQMVMDGFTSTQEKVDEISAKLLKGFDDILAQSATPLQATSERNSNTLDEFTNRSINTFSKAVAALQSHADSFSKGVTSTVTSLEDLSSKLRKMQTPEEVIEIKLQPTLQGVSRAVNNFTKEAQAFAERMAKIQAETDSSAKRALEEATRDTRAALASIDRRLDSSISTRDALAEIVTRFTASVAARDAAFHKTLSDTELMIKKQAESTRDVALALGKLTTEVERIGRQQESGVALGSLSVGRDTAA